MDSKPEIITGETQRGSAPSGKKPQRKGAKNRKFEKFRTKKNQEFQVQLTASLLKRLHVSDPTTVSAIKLRSSVAPAAVPITFRALPRFVSALWRRMVSIGTRPFSQLVNEVMMLAEAKVACAQMKCTNPPSICPLNDNVVPKEATSTNAASESCTSKLELTVDDILKTPKALGRPERSRKRDSSAKCLTLTNENVMQEELQSQPSTSSKSASKTKKSKEEDDWECGLCEVLYSTYLTIFTVSKISLYFLSTITNLPDYVANLP
ncbi:unnamed protein product [Parnassius apollo]|uniref:(apollo) hypothetical protein n=1 Tax=Parnassius apollo TaxID=110799 RepID=A0A8S3YCP3_PARAO|nr:unnamed protein product [Parnassius apollo]